jgi:hypothetical protein
MDDSSLCDRDGDAAVGLVCRHAAAGVACGFHGDDPSDDDPCPMAWCDLCDELVADGDDWTEEALAAASFRPVCSSCYDRARADNEDVPDLACGAAARMTDDEMDALMQHALASGKQAQQTSHDEWGWMDRASWDYDHDAATITFTGAGLPRLRASASIVGSYASASGTFEWAWTRADSGVDARIAGARAFGEVRGIRRLVEPGWTCPVGEAWAMTMLVGYLVGAAGFFRAPIDELEWFMVLDDWRLVKG